MENKTPIQSCLDRSQSGIRCMISDQRAPGTFRMGIVRSHRFDQRALFQHRTQSTPNVPRLLCDQKDSPCRQCSQSHLKTYSQGTMGTKFSLCCSGTIQARTANTKWTRFPAVPFLQHRKCRSLLPTCLNKIHANILGKNATRSSAGMFQARKTNTA